MISKLFDINSGIISGILLAIITITCANLIFSNTLIDYLSIGIFLALLGSVIMTIVITFGSRIPFNVLGSQDTFAVIAAIVADTIIRKGEGISQETLLITVITLVATMTIFLGIVFYFLGKFRLGKVMEYAPYPVIAGFLAGTGALIVLGGIEISTGVSVLEGHFTGLFQQESLIFWIPECLFALLMLGILERYKNIFLLPLLLVVALGGFYLILWVTGISLEEASQSGYLLGPFKMVSISDFTFLNRAPSIQWHFLFQHFPDYLIATGLGVVALLFNANSLEVVTNRDIDIDEELRATGVANILAGLVGGIGGYQHLATSVINQRLGASSRLSGIARCLTIALITFLGIPLLGVMPKSLFVILLIFLGLYFLYDWLILTYFKISKYEYFVIPFITIAIVVKGLIIGVVLGLLISIAIFTYRSSRIQIIKSILSGEACISNVERSRGEQILLQQHREEIMLVHMQSYIFFGNAIGLVNTLRKRIEEESGEIRYLILDFKHVVAADASTLFSFIKLSRICKNYAIDFLIADLPKQLENEFTVAIESGVPLEFIRIKDTDHALEHCEEKILKKYQRDLDSSIDKNLRELLPHLTKHDDFYGYFQKEKVRAGEVFVKEEELSDCLYILVKGKVEIFTEDIKGNPLRIKQLNQGTIIGEIGLIMEAKRTASIRAIEDAELLKLAKSDLEKLKQEHPKGLSDLYLDIVTITMQRFIETSETVKQLRSSQN